MADLTNAKKPIPLAATGLFLLIFALGCTASDDDTRYSDSDDTDTTGTGNVTTDSTTPDDDDSESNTEPEAIIPICDNCAGVGAELENLRCAIELCDDSIFIEQNYTSPTITNATKLKRSREAVARFGNLNNDLAPLLGESYALMSSGFAKGTNHNTTLNAS